MMDNQCFKANARIILELGKESIESKIVALSEVVKNAYDAGAKKCKIYIEENGENISLIQKRITSIKIIDDGCGMSKNDLIDKWLVIGTTDKKNAKQKNINLSRIPIGEKGIGRFAINKLGNKVTLITKKQGEKCYRLELDFNKFDSEQLLNDILFNIEEVENLDLESLGHGTIIIINELNEPWDDSDISKVYDEILKLQSPFNVGDDQFEIELELSSYYDLKGKLTAKEILNYSLWNCSVEIDPLKKKSTMYFNFTPYKEMQGFSEINEQYDFEYLYKDKKTPTEIALDKFKIGKFTIKLFAFHRTAAVLRMLNEKKKYIKEYLDENGGIRIYRGGQRVYNYGTKNEDWLDLNIKRLNSPGTKLSKNVLIGIIELDAKESTGLIEKTNREGFIENESYLEFKKIVSSFVDEFAFRMIDTKDKIKQSIDKNVKVERVDMSFEELILDIEEAKFENEKDREKIHNHVERLMKDYEESRKIYLTIANNSIDFHMAFHDIDKQIKGLMNLINNNSKNMNEIVKLIRNIDDIVNLQKDLISQRDFKLNSVDKILEKFNTYAKYRNIDHKIETIVENDDIVFKCIGSQILRILINLFDNSVYWLSLREKDRKIFIKFYIENQKVCILFADNGPGFGVNDTSVLFKPFVTKKDEGLGLGLYIVNEIVNIHQGKIEILEKSALIPKEYVGAKLKIELKME